MRIIEGSMGIIEGSIGGNIGFYRDYIGFISNFPELPSPRLQNPEAVPHRAGRTCAPTRR